ALQGTLKAVRPSLRPCNAYAGLHRTPRNRNIAKTPYIQSHQTPQHQKNRNFTTQPAPPQKKIAINRNKSQKTKAARLKPSSMPQSQ
ncbi:hypothetical protein, partial [Bifidobacterium adolescentis]|uniref:hypothetical protein n=1 Tax=Bifidobacterium adolescentis TaxID=1680 RepID=UPI00321C0001